MNQKNSNITLHDWQIDFVNKYLTDQKPKSLLVASVGTGKTVTSMYTAARMIEGGYSDSVLTISDYVILKEQWKLTGGLVDLEFIDEINESTDFIGKTANITIQSLKDSLEQNLLSAVRKTNFFIIVDEAHRAVKYKRFENFIAKALQANTKTKVLYISQTADLFNQEFDWQYTFDTQYLFQDTIIKSPEIKIEIAHLSPSYSILEKLLKQKVRIDDLNWREFEKLISQLLEKGGYDVELTRGTKDGGVDVIATMNLGAAGSFKTLWQAKKKLLRNKVGLSIIRELADTRNEFKASKGIIVTTSYLTKDALIRVKRDNYILGKVDRDDLNEWIAKMLV